MKITEKEIIDLKFFRADRQNDPQFTTPSNYHYNLYHLEDTKFSILYIGFEAMWVQTVDRVLYEADISEYLNELPDDIRDYILFNLDIFR